ncbi:MAG: non-ribosomal peptide synthetase [Candidatus Sulfotelmatobacter sp.]
MSTRLNDLSFPITRLVAEHAAAAPNSLAVKAGRESLSYAELERRSNQLAQHLRTLGVGADALVGILLERSPESVIASLAVLKAGAGYLPLNPATPADRLAFMLRDSGLSVVITRDGLAEKLGSGSLGSGSWSVVNLDADREIIGSYSGASVDTAAGANDLAYVIYTSGSTGQPKGVEIPRGGLASLVAWHLRAFEVKAFDRASLLASIGFDATVWEMWPYLAAGASVHIPEDAVRQQVEPLRDWLVGEKITISFVPTPLAELLIQTEWPASAGLRLLLTGADTLHRRPPQGLPFILVNNYGPTESTVVATSGVVAPAGADTKQPSIGRAIDGTQVHILDEQMRPVAAGTSGELFLGGASLARGYRKRADLTAEKFVPNPFGNGSGSAKLYRTGDRVRLLPNGEIEFLGRLDDQIKIRGYRIELDEISAVLNSHPEVKASAVTARDVRGAEVNRDEKRLIAYLVLARQSESTANVFREFLQQRVPDYMIPATFVRVDALPLTTNGKVDRAALPAPNGNTLPEEAYVAPRSVVEQRLAELIAPLLHVERVGANDNFFLLGGHSLLGTQLLTRISETFGIELSLLTIFDRPTLSGMSSEIERLILAKLDLAKLDQEDSSSDAVQPVQPAGDYR